MRPVIVYIATTFPKSTELFLQREISSLLARGVNLRIYSLWGGGGDYEGVTVKTFSKWRVLTLYWMIPYHALRRPRAFTEITRRLFTRKPPSWLNYWENVLGAAFAAIHAREFQYERPALIHAAWGGAPATAAWMFWRFDRHRFSVSCHAYDVYQDGGDWWLNEKLEQAAFVHSSTAMVRRTLIGRGLRPGKVHAIRNGIAVFPRFKYLRTPRPSLRLLCVARLVPKKGLKQQMRIYAALNEAGVAFEARIAGAGPLRAALQQLARELGLSKKVTLLGHLPHSEIVEQLAWADVMLHTGVVAADGDRDGLPNVIAEAMAAGAVVVTSPEAATTEAITDDVTGLVIPVNKIAAWVKALIGLRDDDVRADRLRLAARAWVEENFDARKNTARLVELFEECVRQ